MLVLGAFRRGNLRHYHRRITLSVLKFGDWIFSGAWMLVLGAFPSGAFFFAVVKPAAQNQGERLDGDLERQERFRNQVLAAFQNGFRSGTKITMAGDENH